MWLLRAAAAAIFLGLAGYLGPAWLADQTITAQLDAAILAGNPGRP